MTTESLMVHAIKRGLCITDFQELSVGMILDYINRYDSVCDNKQDEQDSIQASQNEFNNF